MALERRIVEHREDDEQTGGARAAHLLNSALCLFTLQESSLCSALLNTAFRSLALINQSPGLLVGEPSLYLGVNQINGTCFTPGLASHIHRSMLVL